MIFLQVFTFIFFVLLSSISDQTRADDDEDFQKFVEEVEATLNESANYVLPVNNNDFFTPKNEPEPLNYGTYDFIIIGGGTAGGMLANRLTEVNLTVLVVEAGKEGPALSSVLGLASYLYYSDYNWGYYTTPQSNACLGSKNQQCFYPRGKALGGSTVMNGGMYVRGNRKDFDDWEALGNTGWSYDDVLPYFKKSERAEFTIDIDQDYHGLSGPQSINTAEDTPNLTAELLDAFQELGKPESDYNGLDQEGVSRVQFYLDYNIRAGTAHAFIEPAQNRSNLFIITESLVTRILISAGSAYGVEFIRNGITYVANATREVILSAGSINSPQVLMFSGIGPAEELTQHGIEVIADLPVGENLLDHVVYTGLYYRTNEIFYNNTLLENLELWREAKRPLVAGAGAQTVTFWNYDGTENSQPETEIYILPARSTLPNSFQFTDEYVEAFQVIDDLTDIFVTVVLLHPKSIGQVTLQSSDPRDFPLINTNYFSDERDLETIYQGIQTVLSLNNTSTFQNWGAQFFSIASPNCQDYQVMSKDWWFCSIRSITITLFHPIGTTRMGTDPTNSVVNSELKVHGIDHLRVVDAGVMPAHVSGHPNAAVVMIAEKIADAIKAEYEA